MSIDIKKIEEQIDSINETLMKVYSRPAGTCRRVKAAILSLAQKKQGEPSLMFTYKDVQEIGKELIHENLFDYETYSNRNTFNDIIQRLMQEGMLESPFFNVSQQRHRKVYTHFIGIEYKEVLLVAAIDQELRFLRLNFESADNADKETEVVCRMLASFAIHSAVLFKDFHKHLLSIKQKDMDLVNDFMTVKLAGDRETEEKQNTAFYRYFISPISMVYMLLLLSIYKKDLKILKRPLVEKGGGGRVFGDRWINGRTQSLDEVFQMWTARIAEKYKLNIKLDLERFREVCLRYLTLKFPVFLLSVHTRGLRSDSLKMDFLGPLLNPEHPRAVSNDEIFKTTSGKRSDKVFHKLFINDETFKKAVQKIINLRGKLVQESGKKRKKEIAEDIISAIDKITRHKGREEIMRTPIYHNYLIYWEWILYEIKKPSVKGSSIDTYTGSVGRHFITLLTEHCIVDDFEGKDEYLDEEIRQFLKNYISKNNLKNLKKFFRFIKNEYATVLPKLGKKEYRISIRSYPKPLLYFHDISEILRDLEDVNLRLMVILGFYAGLRAGEFVSLKLSSLVYDGGYVLCVRKSKTNNGDRNIPLYLLMPEEYLRELVNHWKSRMISGKPDDLLFSDHGKKLNKKKMSIEVGRLFKVKFGFRIRFHYLRHSFASWFLIRWFAAFYGKDSFYPDCWFLKEDVFRDENLIKIRYLLHGFRVPSKGQGNFSHVLAALARLVGHASPSVTLKDYIHTIDFLSYLFFRRKNADAMAKLTSTELATLLNVSYGGLPANFHGRSFKTLRIQKIAQEQKKKLRLSIDEAGA